MNCADPSMCYTLLMVSFSDPLGNLSSPLDSFVSIHQYKNPCIDPQVMKVSSIDELVFAEIVDNLESERNLYHKSGHFNICQG